MMNESSSQHSELVVAGRVFDKQDEFCQISSDMQQHKGHQDLSAVFLNFLASKPMSQLNFYCS